ncbi:MAG: tetratricopeptide repeat protein [Hyphomicrobiales bacterium]|nr:tetratricopeptide repeat protein [Hyphomicrobiales bacterium]
MAMLSAMVRYLIWRGIRLLPVLAIVGLFGGNLIGPAAVAEPADELEQSPAETEPPASEKSRHQILTELYDSLRQASDEDSAELIANAIEKLWLRSGSDTVDLLMSRAIQMVNEEDLDIALKIFDSVVSLAPDYSEGWNQRATVYFLKKDYESSLNDLRRVLRLDPRHFKAISGLGLIMQELGDKESALRAFRHVLKVHPHLGVARRSVEELTREVEGQGI